MTGTSRDEIEPSVNLPHRVFTTESGFFRFYCDDGNIPFSSVVQWNYCPHCGVELTGTGPQPEGGRQMTDSTVTIELPIPAPFVGIMRRLGWSQKTEANR